MGRTLFGTPSNNVIASIKLGFPTAPSRSGGTQNLTLNVTAYDRWGNVITVPYNQSIELSSTGSTCEVEFAFFSTPTSTPSPLASNLAFNAPSEVAVQFNPSCGGPNPVTITASANGVSNAILTF